MDEQPKQTEKCPACEEKRLHNVREWREFHPLARHGIIDGKPTSPELTVAGMKAAG